MKISPITKVNYGIRTNQNQVRNTKKYSTEPIPNDAVCFKGKAGAIIGGAMGTLLGASCTLLTGGLALPFIVGAGSAISGSVIEDIINGRGE